MPRSIQPLVSSSFLTQSPPFPAAAAVSLHQPVCLNLSGARRLCVLISANMFVLHADLSARAGCCSLSLVLANCGATWPRTDPLAEVCISALCTYRGNTYVHTRTVQPYMNVCTF